MTFADIAAGETLFLDANPLVYHFAPDPVFGPACTGLMNRIANREVLAVTSTHVLSEVAHHLMTIEAASFFGWTSKVVSRLKQQPAGIVKLTNFRRSIEAIAQLPIQVVTIQPDWIAVAAGLSQHHGLLSNDALIAATMQRHGLTHLASADADFDRVPAITRYGPG
jgi:predicted nucleic acid-binding protein